MTHSPTWGVVACGLAMLVGAAVACKPADEPPRRGAAAPGAVDPSAGAGTLADAGATAANLGTIRIVAPDASSLPLAAEADVAPPTQDVAEEVEVGPEVGTALSDAVLEAVRQPPTPEGEASAKSLNAKGLRLHRKLEIAAAIRTYREALKAWPGHPYANYNLACALALAGDRGTALFHLRVLAALEGETPRRRLEVARTDEDLVSLADDPEFRALTGYVPVAVASAPDATDPLARGATVSLLRKAYVPAFDDGVWRKPVDEATLYVRAEDAAALRVAETVEAALRPSPRRVPSRYLAADRPLVLVLPAGAAEELAGGSEATRPEDLLERRLTAQAEGGLEHLHLKKTGFFTWERVEDSGRRIHRTGRYNLDRGALSLDYRQVTETPSATGDAPDIQVDQGRRANHKVVVVEGALSVDGVLFRPAR